MIANCVVGASQDALRELLILASVEATKCTKPDSLSASVDESEGSWESPFRAAGCHATPLSISGLRKTTRFPEFAMIVLSQCSNGLHSEMGKLP